MGLLPLLLGLVFPACASEGAEGLQVPPPMDMTAIVRPSSPNTFLAAPEGFAPPPDRVTTLAADPDRLYGTARRAVLAQERVFLHAEYPERRQLHVVARSARANYPDLVTIQVTADGRLVIWSRSVYGRKDFGANEARVTAWLGAIDAAMR